MVEETAIRVQINAAKLAGQGIFGILQAVASGAWSIAGGVLIIAVATYFGTLTVS